MIAEAKEQNWNFTTEFTESTENGDRWAVIVLRGIERCGLLGESGGKITALHIGGFMKLATTILIAVTLAGAAGPAVGQQRAPLLPEKDVVWLAEELSGETAKRNLEGLARLHRQRGSAGFHAAAELVAERARAYGLSDVAILQFPADGKVFYGTQRSRPGWDAEEGELEEVKEGKDVKDVKEKGNETVLKLASYRAMPIVLAEDSESADVTAELVDVGEGTKESDYAGKDVKGKIVLLSAQPGAAQE